jgi:glycine cleavage system H protein
MRFPSDLKYTKDHEWAKIDGNTAIIGVTDHAQKSLGDIVYCELPPVGRALKKGETCGVVESIKAVSDLYSPVTGKVTAANSAVINDPAAINRSPQAEAWLLKIEITDFASMSDLLSATDYEKFVESLK